ncbi:MAG: ligase-associated DNA damage response exonuclease [Bacteriovoracaceae bacterium]
MNSHDFSLSGETVAARDVPVKDGPVNEACLLVERFDNHFALWDYFVMHFSSSPLITWTEKGLYCEAGGFYIDPHKGVDVAVITHAHSDHARKGSKLYITERTGVELLKTRLGKNISVRSFPYRESFQLGDVTVSFHSAGHILGSSQVRVQRGNDVWVASGDYKRDADPSCEPFEVIECDVFITEATFGTPRFVWQKNQPHGQNIYEWYKENAERGINSIVFGYSLGKAQRILAELAPFPVDHVIVHPTIVPLTQCYRDEGRTLAKTMTIKERIKEKSKLVGELILAPPSIFTEEWGEHLGEYKTAFASGWMQNGGWGRGSYDRGFVMSDHADWNDLNRTIIETKAKKVYVQHRNGALVRHLRGQGLEAHPVEVLKSFIDQIPSGTNLTLI